MEIVGGFMVMMSILGFLMAVVWLVMPLMVLYMKGKLDKTFDSLAGIEKRLSAIESQLTQLQHGQNFKATVTMGEPSAAIAAEDQPGGASGSSLPLPD